MTERQQRIINNQVELDRMKRELGLLPTMRIERTNGKSSDGFNLRSLNLGLLKKPNVSTNVIPR